MIPVYLSGIGLASRLGTDLKEALPQLHSSPPAQWRVITGVDHQVSYYAIDSTLNAALQESVDWYTRCQVLVCQVVAESGCCDKTGALYLASSSVNLGAVEAKQADQEQLSKFVTEFAEMLGWQGPVSWINTACTSGINALLAGMQAIESGAVENALIVGLELENKLTLAGFSAMQLLAPEQAMPFSARRNGLVLGEAVAAIRLSKQPGRWQLHGGAQVVDSSQISGASSDAYQSMLRKTLVQAQLGAGQIDLIKVQAAGSVSNDAIEAQALHGVFSEMPALLSLKSILGHTLGASGVAEMALLIALLEQEKWPDHSLDSTELDLDLGVNLAATCPARVKYLLACNLGFGGSHACALLEDTSV